MDAPFAIVDIVVDELKRDGDAAGLLERTLFCSAWLLVRADPVVLVCDSNLISHLDHLDSTFKPTDNAIG